MYKADLQELINDLVQESKTIDYKRDIVGNTDEHDVSQITEFCIFDDETPDYFDKMNNVEEIASLLHEVLLI